MQTAAPISDPPFEASWPTAPPLAQRPPPGVAWCWRIVVDPGDTALEGRLGGLLDAGERQSAGRFLHHADRALYIAAHAGVRLLLGTMLGRAPATLRLRRKPAGKPHLADADGLEFSLSHSGSVVLIAIAGDISIGVDVERLRPLPDLAALAARVLHPAEQRELAALSAAEMPAAFLRCWTRKEAVAKALGLGLALPFKACLVSFRPGAPAALLALDGAEPAATLWSLHDLVAAQCHIGALAAPQPGLSVVCRTLTWPG
jgi:4'-phosphopantetheinyl transferase